MCLTVMLGRGEGEGRFFSVKILLLDRGLDKRKYLVILRDSFCQFCT